MVRRRVPSLRLAPHRSASLTSSPITSVGPSVAWLVRGPVSPAPCLRTRTTSARSHRGRALPITRAGHGLSGERAMPSLDRLPTMAITTAFHTLHPASAGGKSDLILRHIVRLPQMYPRVQRTTGLVGHASGVTPSKSSGAQFGLVGGNVEEERMAPTWNKFRLDIFPGIRLLAGAERGGFTRGETSRTSNSRTAPEPELNPRSLRAAVRSERHRWLIDRGS